MSAKVPPPPPLKPKKGTSKSTSTSAAARKVKPSPPPPRKPKPKARAKAAPEPSLEPNSDLQPLTKTRPHGLQPIELKAKESGPKEVDKHTPTGLMGPREESGLRFPMARMERRIREHWAGEVVAAVLPGPHEQVQVLALRPTIQPTRKVVERCAVSGRGTAKVRGHGVARFVELLRLEDGRLGVATEPIEGKCLADEVDRSKMQLGRAIGILRQLANILRSAEKARLSHGSLCVDALWLSERDGRKDALMLADFGLEALMEAHLQDDEFDAPHRPYSPERLLGLDRGHEDIYLFGCVAHHLLAGRPPFAREKGEELRRSHSIQDVPPIRRTATDLLGPIAMIVDRCLANDSNERFESFGEVEAALCMAQVDTGLRTPWDDLPLPAIPSGSRKRVEQFFGPRRQRDIVAVGTAEPAVTVVPEPAPGPTSSPAAPSSAPVAAATAGAAVGRAVDSEPLTPLPGASLPAGAADPVLATEPESQRQFPMGLAVVAGMAGVGVLLGAYLLFGRTPSAADDGLAQEVATTRSGTEAEEPQPGAVEATAAADESSAEDEAPAEAATDGAGETDEVGEPAVEDGDPDEPALALLEPDEGPIVGQGPTKGGAEEPSGEPDEPTAEDVPTAAEQDEPESSSKSVSQLLASAASARKSGNTSRAIKLYKQVLTKEPKNRKALPALGDLYFNRSDYKNAAKYFKKAVAATGSASHRLSLGDAYYKLGRYADAKSQYVKAKAKGSSAAAKRIDKVNKKLGG